MADFISILHEPEGEILLSIIAVISIFFMICCVWSVLTIVKKRQLCNTEVKCKIVDFKAKREFSIDRIFGEKDKDSYRYKPIFEYEYNGKTYKYESKFVTFMDKADLNEFREIYINQEDPTKVREKEDFNIWSSVVACVAANIVLVLFFWLAML